MFTKFDFVIRNCGKLNIEAITNTESSESSKKLQYKSKISTPQKEMLNLLQALQVMFQTILPI